MWKTSFVSFLLVLALPAIASGQIAVFPNCDVPGNLVLNCGFESPVDFEFWTVSGDTRFMQVTADARHSGNRGAKLNPMFMPGFLSQILQTVPGQSYDVTFWLHNDHQPNQFFLYWDGTLISSSVKFTSTPNRAESDFIQPLFSRQTARSGSTVLSFGFFNPAGFFFLDDVVVLPTAGLSQTNAR